MLNHFCQKKFEVSLISGFVVLITDFAGNGPETPERRPKSDDDADR